jgi:hypothetical protein
VKETQLISIAFQSILTFSCTNLEKLLETSAESVLGLFRNRGMPIDHNIWHGQHNYHISKILCMSNFTHLLVQSCSLSCSFAVTTGEPSWQWPSDTLHTCSTKTHCRRAEGRDAVLCMITSIQNKTVCKNSHRTTCSLLNWKYFTAWNRKFFTEGFPLHLIKENLQSMHSFHFSAGWIITVHTLLWTMWQSVLLYLATTDCTEHIVTVPCNNRLYRAHCYCTL